MSLDTFSPADWSPPTSLSPAAHFSISALETRIAKGESSLRLDVPTGTTASVPSQNGGADQAAALREHVEKRIPYTNVQVIRNEERFALEISLNAEALQHPATFARAFGKYCESNGSAEYVASRLTREDWHDIRKQCFDETRFTGAAGELHTHVMLRSMLSHYNKVGGAMDVMEGHDGLCFQIDDKLRIRCLGHHNWTLKHEGCAPVEIDNVVLMNGNADRFFVFDVCTSGKQVEEKLRNLRKLSQRTSILNSQSLKVTMEKFHVVHESNLHMYEQRDGCHILNIPCLKEVIRLKYALLNTIRKNPEDMLAALKDIR